MQSYKEAAKETIRSRCAAQRAPVLQRHGSDVPYGCIQLGPSGCLKELLRREYPWEVLTASRGWCRMRAGLLELAERRACIFCGVGVKYPTIHCMGKCAYWQARRSEFLASANISPDVGIRQVALAVLRIQPAEQGFVEAVLWAGAVDKAAEAWRSQNKQ